MPVLAELKFESPLPSATTPLSPIVEEMKALAQNLNNEYGIKQWQFYLLLASGVSSPVIICCLLCFCFFKFFMINKIYRCLFKFCSYKGYNRAAEILEKRQSKLLIWLKNINRD